MKSLVVAVTCAGDQVSPPRGLRLKYGSVRFDGTTRLHSSGLCIQKDGRSPRVNNTPKSTVVRAVMPKISIGRFLCCMLLLRRVGCDRTEVLVAGHPRAVVSLISTHLGWCGVLAVSLASGRACGRLRVVDGPARSTVEWTLGGIVVCARVGTCMHASSTLLPSSAFFTRTMKAQKCPRHLRSGRHCTDPVGRAD